VVFTDGMKFGPGVWLLGVDLGEIAGLTVLRVAEDGSATPLGDDGTIYVFPTRSGLAGYLQSHPTGWAAGFDPRTVEPASAANFIWLRDNPPAKRDRAEDMWECLALAKACGVPPATSIDAMIRDVAFRTVLRTDFERPGYAEFDYWLDRQIIPVTLILPAGTGITLADSDVVCGSALGDTRFLGESDTVWMFRNEQDLIGVIDDGLPDELCENKWWDAVEDNPPNCHPLLTFDLTMLPKLTPPDLDTWQETLGVLENLTMTLTGSVDAFRKRPLDTMLTQAKLPQSLSPRKQSQLAGVLRHLVDDVDARITWVTG
jgi:hypothetical protein